MPGKYYEHASSLSPLNVPSLDIDKVIALQHRRATALWSWTLWCNAFDFVVYGIITIIVPYVAIFPGGSLTVVIQDVPYGLVLLVTLACLMFGTKHLFSHNKTNLSFGFSHLLSATRNYAFDQLLGNASRHHDPAKVLSAEVGQFKFGIIKASGREAFVAKEELQEGNGDEQDDEDKQGIFCRNTG
ncbi:hypothetical protein DXG01_000967, partial [Tephrocybe rancida]